MGAIIGKAFLYIACVLSGECLDILTELKEVIDQFGSAAPEDYLWGAEQLLDAVGLWPLLPKIQAAMPWLMSFTMSMIPGWGDLYDLTSAVLGYDPITGDKLSKWMRVVAFVAALIPILSSAQVRAVDNVALNAVDDIADDTVIQLYGFRGAGSAYKSRFVPTEPLLYAGHVGISFDEGRTIYGFTPHTPGLSNEEVISEMLYRQRIYPGRVANDTYVFHRAQDLAEQEGLRTQVYVWSQSYSHREYRQIRKAAMNDMARSPLRHKAYGFPQADQICYNCATWPATIGVNIPEETGELRYYMEILQQIGQPWHR